MSVYIYIYSQFTSLHHNEICTLLPFPFISRECQEWKGLEEFDFQNKSIPVG